jgi:S1-C subfamily serine protease
MKHKPLAFGIALKELTPEMRKRNGTNRGVAVAVVMKNSPAFNADVFEDDIITKIGSLAVSDQTSFQQALKANTGSTPVTIVRDGKELIKVVEIGRINDN